MRTPGRKSLTLLLAAAMLALAGCGKKGEPSPPGPPSQVIYPKSYPKTP